MAKGTNIKPKDMTKEPEIKLRTILSISFALLGFFVTGFFLVAMYNIGKLDGLLGIDLDASSVLAIERSTLYIGLAILAFFIPILFVLGWTLGSILAKPVSSLLKGVTRICEGDLDYRVEVLSLTEIGRLASSFNKMADHLKQLIFVKDVSEGDYTNALRTHMHNLESAVKIHQVLTSTLDPNQLADELVENFQTLFNLCFVGIYRIYEEQNIVRLFSASGEVGKVLIERGLEFPQGDGFVGWVSAYEKPRIALQVEKDPLWIGIEELPDIKSAGAFPLRSRGKILGVLCLCSPDLGTFEEEDTQLVLQSLADQVGMGLDNAFLFTQSQEDLRDSQRTFSLMSRSAWDEMLQSRNASGYRASNAGLEEIISSSDEEVVIDSKYLKLPVTVRGRVLATISAAKPKDAQWWSDDEITLMKTLAEQLGVALENARLFSTTQRSAERERILTDISNRVRASTNLDVILQTAVQDLADVLKVSKGSIQLRMRGGEASSRRSSA